MLRATTKFPIVTAVIIVRRAADSIAIPTHHGSMSLEPFLERILKSDELVSAGGSPKAGAALASNAFQLGGRGR